MGGRDASESLVAIVGMRTQTAIPGNVGRQYRHQPPISLLLAIDRDHPYRCIATTLVVGRP
jgi:hypothetical protein